VVSCFGGAHKTLDVVPTEIDNNNAFRPQFPSCSKFFHGTHNPHPLQEKTLPWISSCAVLATLIISLLEGVVTQMPIFRKHRSAEGQSLNLWKICCMFSSLGEDIHL
jgi:hypothetical protein